MKIPLMRGTFFQEADTKEKLIEFIRGASRLSMGEQCKAFEEAFAKWHKRKHAVFVSNGSAANLVLLQAMMNRGLLAKGDKVGFSALTWATNVMPIIQLGMIPVPIDCEIETLNVSPKLLGDRIAGLKAFFITNALGFCDDLSAIKKMCEEKHVILIEDNCESLGSEHGGTLLGNFSLASTCSFFVGHHLSTIEGGMVLTDDSALAEMLIMVRAHGWDRQLPSSSQKALRIEHGISDFDALYTFYELAYNTRPSEINGFLGLVQLPLLDATITKRENNFTHFYKALSAKPDLYYAVDAHFLSRFSNFAMPVVCKSPEIREETVKRFQEAGVEVRPLIAGDITQHPFYTKYAQPMKCEKAAIIHAQGFYFPNHPDLTEAEVETLCGLL